MGFRGWSPLRLARALTIDANSRICHRNGAEAGRVSSLCGEKALSTASLLRRSIRRTCARLLARYEIASTARRNASSLNLNLRAREARQMYCQGHVLFTFLGGWPDIQPQWHCASTTLVGVPRHTSSSCCVRCSLGAGHSIGELIAATVSSNVSPASEGDTDETGGSTSRSGGSGTVSMDMGTAPLVAEG